jgi:membrane-bound inhibitor of C-type lysozyme
MPRACGRAVRLTIGVAYVLLLAASAAKASSVLTAGHPDAAPILVQRVSHGAAQPELGAYERKVEGIREGLAALDRIEGSYSVGDRSVSYVAFVDGALPIVVAEQWDLGEYGRGEAVFHFTQGDLVRYRSLARGLSEAGAPSDGWYERTMTIYFGPDRFVAGTGAVNGRPAEPDEHEVRAAWRQAEEVKARIAAARAAGVPRADPSRARYACADGAVFAATFDLAGRRAVVEFLGREPIVLPQVWTSRGFLYADERHRLHGRGEEALWASGAVALVACTLAATSTPLRLAPGDYPLFDPKAKPADDWSRLLVDFMPAVRTCLGQEVGHLPRVLKAWPMSKGMTGVRLQNLDGGRYQCIAAADGAAIDRLELLAFDASALPGESDPIFTPADGAYPGGICFSHERVEVGAGRFLGWLSTRIC